MKFSNYLIENKYSSILDEDEAIEHIKTYCSDMDITLPIWRGMTDKGKYLLLNSEGRIKDRKSRQISNHYTILIDHFLQQENSKYPLRSKSFICINNLGYKNAREYGDLYAVFPYNGTLIGEVPSWDIWRCKAKIGNTENTLVRWAQFLKANGIDDTNYESIVDSIKKNIKEKNEDICKIFDNDINNVEPYLQKGFNPDALNFKFKTTTNIIERNNAELWFEGKCVAIQYYLWERIINKMLELD